MKLLFLRYSLKFLLSLIIWFISAPAYSQIQIEVQNSPSKIYYLQQVKGDRLIMVDSLLVENDNLLFEWKDSYLQGMYRLFDGEHELLFMADNMPIVLYTVYPELQEQLIIKESLSNHIWFEYLEVKKRTYENLDLLNPIVNWYDKDSEYYQITLNEFKKQQNTLPLWLDEQSKKYKELLAIKFIQADLKPLLPQGLSIQEQQEFFKQHWFDQVDWHDQDLIHSDILTNKITEYLGLYANRNMQKAELQMAFKYAVDQIIPLSQDDNEMYAFVLDYLVRGFERFNFEDVILHIAINYPPPTEQCENEERKSEALNRLAKYESMQIGQKATDFILPNLQGEDIQLSSQSKEKILLVFWASWCPHCKELIPKLQEWYSQENQKSWQVFAISIDTENDDLESYLSTHDINLPVLCDFKGWDTQAALDYNIYATPTMIVLDKDLKILSKPLGIYDL